MGQVEGDLGSSSLPVRFGRELFLGCRQCTFPSCTANFCIPETHSPCSTPASSCIGQPQPPPGPRCSVVPTQGPCPQLLSLVSQEKAEPSSHVPLEFRAGRRPSA